MKQKNLFLFILLVAMTLPAYAQNKIGDNPTVIQSGSLLELESLTKGLRLPRVELNDVTAWTLDGTAVSGMVIFNETGTAPKGMYYWNMDSAQWIQIVNKSELSTLVANYLTQNTAVRDSIVNVVNSIVSAGSITGKDLTSNSPVLKVVNGAGTTLNATQVDLDQTELSNLFSTSPLSDGLSTAISNNTTIQNSIQSVVNSTISNGTVTGKDLTSNSPVLKVVNGTGSTIKATQVDLDQAQLSNLFSTSPLSDGLSTAISNNTTIQNSIQSVVNSTISNGTVTGKDLTSNSPVIKVVNGTGSTIKATQVDLDQVQLSNLFSTSPLSDGLSTAISNSTTIKNSIQSVVNSTTTNTLSAASGKLTSTVNGISANLTPASGTIAKSLGFDASGALVTAGSTPTSNSLSATNGQLISTVNGVASTPAVSVLNSADNGLSVTNGNVQLGGTLTQPTTLTASATNTLAVNGLQNGDASSDNLLVITPATGIVKKVSVANLGVNQYQSLAVATDGQLIFATPATITDIKKIQVYRNGINVKCTIVDDTHIQLDSQAVCYADDEVKIIQLL